MKAIVRTIDVAGFARLAKPRAPEHGSNGLDDIFLGPDENVFAADGHHWRLDADDATCLWWATACYIDGKEWRSRRGAELGAFLFEATRVKLVMAPTWVVDDGTVIATTVPTTVIP